MWVKQCHKPPMTGNGKHTHKNGDDSGMVYGIVLPTWIWWIHCTRYISCRRSSGKTLPRRITSLRSPRSSESRGCPQFFLYLVSWRATNCILASKNGDLTSNKLCAKQQTWWFKQRKNTILVLKPSGLGANYFEPQNRAWHGPSHYLWGHGKWFHVYGSSIHGFSISKISHHTQT